MTTPVRGFVKQKTKMLNGRGWPNHFLKRKFILDNVNRVGFFYFFIIIARASKHLGDHVQSKEKERLSNGGGFILYG